MADGKTPEMCIEDNVTPLIRRFRSSSAAGDAASDLELIAELRDVMIHHSHSSSLEELAKEMARRIATLGYRRER